MSFPDQVNIIVAAGVVLLALVLLAIRMSVRRGWRKNFEKCRTCDHRTCQKSKGYCPEDD